MRQVLAEIGAEHGAMPRELLVVNKIDAAGDLQLARLRHLLPDAVFVSARRGDGIARLRERIAELLPRLEVELELLVPYPEGSLVARVHAEGEVLAEEHTPEGTLLRARVGPELASARPAVRRRGHPPLTLRRLPPRRQPTLPPMIAGWARFRSDLAGLLPIRGEPVARCWRTRAWRRPRWSIDALADVVVGPVAHTLADLPERADLLVIGSRGYRFMRRLLLGGVAGALVRSARYPVVIVPSPD